MKTSRNGNKVAQLRKLIREQVKKVLNESNTKHPKAFGSFRSNTNVDSTDGTYLTEQSLEDLHAKIEKYYGRKLEPSQIIALTGKDDEIAALLSKYRKLKRSGS